MGEIFKKELPNSILPFTGERFADGHDIETEIEHYHRYFFARSYCRGQDVLDIASGEGYGSAILAQVASSVVGIDICEEAISHAQTVHTRSNLKYLTGDVRNIPLEDHSVDVVVSFETLEHFYEHDLFMQEVKRILRPGGYLIISTPNSDIYSAVGIPANPYHVNELTKTEFTLLCKKYFKYMNTVNQRAIVGSILIGDNDASGLPILFESRDKEHVEYSKGLSRAFYLISVLSDEDKVTAHNSIYINESIRNLLNTNSQIFQQALEEKNRHIENIENILLDKNKHIENIENILLDKNKHIENLENIFPDKNKHIENLENNLLDKNKHIENLENILLDKNRHIENLENILLDINRHIENLENNLLDQNRHIESLENNLLDKNRHIESLENILLDKNRHIESLENILLDKNRHIENLENNLLDKNRHIENLENILLDQNRHIESLENNLLDKNRHIESLENNLLDKNRHIESLENILLIKNKHIESLEDFFLEKNREIQLLRREIEYFKNKFSRSLITWIRKIILNRNAIKICSKSIFFDANWYLTQYPDVKETGINPVVHYVKFGVSEYRNPGPNFSTKDYLIKNPKVQNKGINPLLHFEKMNKKSRERFVKKESVAES